MTVALPFRKEQSDCVPVFAKNPKNFFAQQFWRIYLMYRLVNGIVLLAFVFLALSPSVQGAAILWKDGVNGDLSLNTNWVGDVTPGAADHVGFGMGSVAHFPVSTSTMEIAGMGLGYSADGLGTGCALYQSGGTLTVNGSVANSTYLGYNEYAYQNLAGGTYSWSSGGGHYSIGYLVPAMYEQTGGTAIGTNPGDVFIGGSTAGATSGVMSIRGGLYQLNNKAWNLGVCLGFGYTSSGVLNLGGGSSPAVLDVLGTGTVKGFVIVGYGGGTGVVNLGPNSTIKNVGFVKAAGGSELTGSFNFHGGVLEATESTAVADGSVPDVPSFMDNIGQACIYSEGAKISVASGHTSLINQVISDPQGYGVTATSISLPTSGTYFAPPMVTISGGSGQDATGYATLDSSGNVTGVVITNPGTNFSPFDTGVTVTYHGGGQADVTLPVDSSLFAANTAGTFTKLGQGNLILGGLNSYTGATVVQEGRLTVYTTGGIANSSGVVVKSSAILSGQDNFMGYVPNVTVETGGMIDPGVVSGSSSTNGELMLGSLRLQNHSKLHFNLASMTSDRISVNSGDVTEYTPGTAITVDVDYVGTPSASTLLSVSPSFQLDPNNKITFSFTSKPILDSFDGINSTQASLSTTRGFGGSVQLVPAGVIADPSWNSATGGNWGDSAKWGPPNDVPNADDERAMFTSILGDHTIPISLTVSPTVSSMIFASPYYITPGTGESYVISASGGNFITLSSSIASDWHITVRSGEHAVNSGIQMAVGTGQSVIQVADNAHLTLGGALANAGTAAAGVNFKGNFVDGITSGLGTGILTLSGANTYTGKTTVQNGVLELKSLGNVGVANTLGMSSADPANFMLTDCTLKYSGPAGNSTDRGFTVNGIVNVQMVNNATIAGQIVGAVGSTLNVNGASTLTLGYSGTSSLKLLQVGVGSAGPGKVLQTAGTVELADKFSFGQSAGASFYTMTGGTLTQTAASGGSFWAHNGEAHLVMSGDSVFNQSNQGWIQMGSYATSQDVGTVELSGNAQANLNWFIVGVFGPAAFNVSGNASVVQGNVAPDCSLSLSYGTGGYGEVNVSGGTYTSNSTTNGVGVRVGSMDQGYGNGTGVLSVSGAGKFLIIDGSWVENNIKGIVNIGTKGVGGGTLKAAGIYGINGSGAVNFHGGTLVASADNGEYLNSSVYGTHQAVYVYGEGGTIDTNGKNIAIDEVLQTASGTTGVTSVSLGSAGGAGYKVAPVVVIEGDGFGATAVAELTGGVVTNIRVTNPGTGYTTAPTVTLYGGGFTTAATATSVTGTDSSAGGLNKTGLGTLTLSGLNTFTGPMTVEQGTLSIPTIANGGSANPSPIGASTSDSANLVLGGGGKLLYTGAVATTDRGFTLAAGGGAIETAENLTFSGSVVGIGDGGLTKDGIGTLTLTGSVEYAGSTVINAGTLAFSDNVATVADISGSGSLAVYGTAVLTATSIQVDTLTIGGTGGAALAAVPEPTTLVLLALAGIGMVGMKFRRKPS
jgi:autotransporter-associated beta strand protein